MRGKHAVVEEQLHLGPWGQGRQLLEELDRLEEQMRRAVAPGLAEFDEHTPVGSTFEPLLR